MRHYSATVGLPFDPVACEAAIETRRANALRHKQRRFMVRLARGFAVGIAKGCRLRWFVLTQSDASLEAGLRFYPTFHRFVTWLRYWYPDFQYCVVEHWKRGNRRPDFHVVCYGEDFLAAESMEYWWSEHFLSSLTGMEMIRFPERAAKYLAGYLSAEGDSRFVKSTCSQGWVFPGWIGSSEVLHRRWGRYLGEAELATLAVMSPAERSFVLTIFGDGRRLYRDCISK